MEKTLQKVYNLCLFVVFNLESITQLKRIQRLQTNMKIGIFFVHPPSMEGMKGIFKWCKENLIVDIFAATYIQEPRDERVLNIFTFKPFGPFDLLNVTGGSETYERFFPTLKSNFQRHQLVLIDWSYRQYSDLLVWHYVCRQMNATYTMVKSNITNTSELFKSGIDVIASKFIVSKSTNMYPLQTETQVIIVPEALPYPEFAAYLRTASFLPTFYLQ